MGACCSCHRIQNFESFYDGNENNIVYKGDLGAHVYRQGASKYISMFSQQGRKGINQDAMTVWENFGGDRDMTFCGVFDGHGPSGHKVACHVRDHFPSKLSSFSKRSFHEDVEKNNNNKLYEHCEDYEEYSKIPFYSYWKGRIVNSFKELDENLEEDATIDSYCSGTTAVTVYKKGDHLIIANLGDSRAVLCTRDGKNQLIAEQLTVDLKPNVPNEAERIISCQGRVMAMVEEPNVYRVWMPDEDVPGLAMARAFGDFCLKDFGLISTPQLFYRKLISKDEFVVLATDGVWDVLPNDEVVEVVASASKREVAAKLLVERAVLAWGLKYPNARVDDCSVVCLFFKRQGPRLIKSYSEQTNTTSLNHTESAAQRYGRSMKNDDGLDTVLNYHRNQDDNTYRKRYSTGRSRFVES